MRRAPRFLYPLRILAGALLAAGVMAQGATPAPQLQVDRAGPRLVVSWPALEVDGSLALNIVSDRNARVPRFSDVSPLQPAVGRAGREAPAELWLPVVDLVLESDMHAVIELADVGNGAHVALNSWVQRTREPLQPVLRFSAGRLLHWENTLWIDRRAPRILRFQVRKPVPRGAGSVALGLLDADWGGRLELIATAASGRETILAAQELARPAKTAAPKQNLPPAGDALQAARLHGALAAALTHTLRSQVNDPRDPMRGGLYLFYDLDARTYRTSHWVWGWGPSAGLLLEARKRPEIAARFSTGALLEAARGIGEAGLRSVPTDPKHPARGIPVSRWDRAPRIDLGHEWAFTPCDAGFFAAWTWIRLAEATGERKWRDASERLAEALARLMQEFPIPPQNYWPDYGRWDDKVIDEAGFGVELFTELHRLTGDGRHRELGARYIEQHIKALGRLDGLWDRVHFLDGRPNTPTIRMTRGMGWPMEGLLAAHRLLPESGRYLELARSMAQHLLATQKPEGWWSHRFDQPAEAWGVGTKGTALWCWLLYDLHRHTRDAAHLAAARRALRWLLDQQYFGEDENARGGHVTVSPHSAVGLRPWYRITCTYGSAFFGLAILEELKQQENHPAR